MPLPPAAVWDRHCEQKKLGSMVRVSVRARCRGGASATSFKNVISFLLPNGSRVVGVLDSGAVGPGFKSQPRRSRVTVLGKLSTPIVPLFTKQRKC